MKVVELILAILPLVISAVEHNKKLRRPVKALISNKDKNDQQLEFYTELYDELALLKKTLNDLLSGMASPVVATGLPQLTNDQRKEIERILASDAEAFNSIFERVLKSLEDLVSDKSLEISRSDIPIHSSSPFFEKLEHFHSQILSGQAVSTLRKRFRFTRNEKSRQVALQKIQKANMKLERLTRGSLPPTRANPRPVGIRKPHPTRLRRFSEPLFEKIAGKWLDVCECHNHHEARLCLWNCCSAQRDARSSDSLDLLVSVFDVGIDGSPWQDSTILVSDHAVATPTVRFAVDDQLIAETSEKISPGRDIESESFCRLIHQAHGHQSRLEIVFDQGKLWQTRSRRGSLGLQKQKDITLKDVLYTPKNRITLKQQRILAVTLAHAALHCSDGPWLCSDWSKEHISFFKSSPLADPDISRPFLKVYFEDRANGPIQTSESCSLFSLHSNPALLALGVLLLEIYKCQPIELLWAEEDLIDGKPNENTNLTTALRLLQECEDEVYEGYRSAIQACLEYDGLDGDVDEMRQRIYKDIVFPLEEELQRGFHIKPEDLRGM